MIPRLEQLLLEQNWGSYSFDIQQVNDPHLITAGISDTSDWNIRIQVDGRLDQLNTMLAGFKPNGTSLLSKLRRNGNYFSGKDNLDSLLYFVVGHEIGHWKYSPGHIDDREEILSGVAEGLGEIGFTGEQIQRHSHRVYNYFVDVLDNVMNMYRNKQSQRFSDGFLAFYAKEGLLSPYPSYTDDFFVSVDVTSRLGIDDSEMKRFASAFSKDYKSLIPTSREVIKLLTEDEALSDKAMEGRLALEEKVRIYHALDDREKWHSKAKEFAKLIGQYMRDQEQHSNSLSSRESHGQQDGQETRELIKRSLRKGHSTAYAPQAIALDEIYRDRAEKIIMRLQAEEGENLRLPVGYLQRRKIDDGNFDLNRVDWQNPEIGIDEQGNEELEFFEKQAPFFDKRKGYERGGQVPDILFLIDKSGSTTDGYDPVKGEGPYDMVLRSVYSVLKHLEDSDQIQHMQFGTLLFESIPNYFSGWHSYFDMQEVKEPLLNPNRYGIIDPNSLDPKRNKTLFDPDTRTLYILGTNLDARVVQEATDSNDKKFWAILVSDGDIHNVPEAYEAISYIASRGNYLSFVRVRNGSFDFDNSERVVAHVRSVGGMVHDVTHPEDLPRLVLGEAREIYGDM